MKYPVILTAALLACTLSACNMKTKQDKPSKVEVRQIDDRYRLYVDGKEFYVKGAGCECWEIPNLAGHGGNAFRTWMDSPAQRDGLEMLDEAQEYGLKILMGIKVERERHGFDYDDEEAVARQKEAIRETVMKYKDHPALLGWGIGNELNLRATNMKVWDAVNDISRMIHELDGNHPTTTMLAGIGKKEVDYLDSIGSDLDFLCVQFYGDIVNLARRLDDAGYSGPYLVTEWGATGHWEVARTSWNAAIEQTSTEKADAIRDRYQNVILKDDKNCMGSFVFLWGQKQERTPTWYGLFTEKGEEMEAISTMQHLWTGEWPENRAPRLLETSLDSKSRFDNIMLAPGKEYTAEVDAMDADGDSLRIRWEILRESTDLRDGGDLENRPDSIAAALTDWDVLAVTFTAPAETGPYRLFLYVLDGHNHAATVNFPFFVKE